MRSIAINLISISWDEMKAVSVDVIVDSFAFGKFDTNTNEIRFGTLYANESFLLPILMHRLVNGSESSAFVAAADVDSRRALFGR